MSKQKQKGKKDDLEGFDLKKEKELLKKLRKQENEGEEEQEEEAEGEEEIVTTKKQNIFTSDLFQKAQVMESKKSQKKKKKAKQETTGTTNKEMDQGKDEDSQEELVEEENDVDRVEIEDETGIEEVKQRHVEPESQSQRTQKPQKANENQKKQGKAQKSTENGREEKIKKSSGKESQKDGEEKKGKSDKIWHISVTIFLIGYVCLLLFSKYNQEKYQKAAWYNRGEGIQDDLYEVLELDSSASAQDVKKQFKKLAVAWHPDKNPTCGQVCNEKFDKIHKAYEVLSDPEKRKNYDENSGVFSPIKSKTVSLTMNNYKRLVEDSNDIWIIQIYEDGNPYCIYIADTWESVAKSYGNSVKFGRVNAVSQIALLKYLPYHITLFPTIMALVPGEYPEIFTPPRYNLEMGFKKFIESNIINFVKSIDEKSFLEKWGANDKKSFSAEQRKPDVIYITNGDTIPIFYKYAAFQLHELYDFYQNTFGEANKIRKALQKSKLDFYVALDQLKDENKEERYERETFAFQVVQDTIPTYFHKVQELVKFNTIPELDKHLYAEFCGGSEGSVKNDQDYDFDNELKPSICILLFKNSTSTVHQKNLYDIQKYQKVKNKRLYLNIVNNEPLFENYYQLRVGVVDLSSQRKFRKIIEEFSQKNEHTFPSAIAFIHENGKYFTWDSSYDLIDFLEKIENADDNLDAYYASEVLDSRHLNDFLFSRNENIFTVSYRTFKNTVFDVKILAGLALIILVNIFLLKKTFGTSVINGITYYIIMCVLIAVFGTYQELF